MTNFYSCRYYLPQYDGQYHLKVGALAPTTAPTPAPTPPPPHWNICTSAGSLPWLPVSSGPVPRDQRESEYCRTSSGTGAWAHMSGPSDTSPSYFYANTSSYGNDVIHAGARTCTSFDATQCPHGISGFSFKVSK